ncbi:MAG: YciI family protein [Bryobacteraceae bacterium]
MLLTAAAAELLAQTPQPTVENAGYNAGLARQLGADDYGMKNYVIAFLKSGPTKLSGEEAEQLQNAHLKNLMRLADEGKLVVAGPFRDEGEVRGIFILNVETVEEARKLTESDPAVQRGTLQFELRPWYGSATLMEVTRIHKSIEKKSVAH